MSSSTPSSAPTRPLACTSCRLRRVKCDHNFPTCNQCLRSDLSCSWPESRKQRARKTGGDSTSVETNWLNLFENNASTSYMWPAYDPVRPTPESDLMNMLQNLPAVVHEVANGELELYYYKFSGSTAIQPGVNRVNLRLHSTQSLSAPSPPNQQLFDEEGMPLLAFRQPAFEAFYTHLSSQYPAISRLRMNERFQSNTMSQFLANTICALGARAANDLATAEIYFDKAASFVLAHTQLPTSEAVSAMMLLAWSAYGQGNESGLWQFTGMAIRMGLDIGLHQTSEIFDSPQHRRRSHLLFWTLFATDRVISFTTGRPPSIAEDIVEIPLPVDEDMYPIAARDDSLINEPVEPVPFVYYVRLMIIVGRISNLLNGRRDRIRTLATSTDGMTVAERLSQLQISLIQFFTSLPVSLRWSMQTFRHQTSKGHGGVFLALHLWAHAVLALTYHPELLKHRSGVETPSAAGMSRNIKLAMSSAKQISECIGFADLQTENCYTTSPQVVQPIFVACMALIHEMKESNEDSTQMYFQSMARESYLTLNKALCRIAMRWKAVNVVLDLLEQRSGLPRSIDGAGGAISISAPDTGILRRFTIKSDHPLNVAQPTEKSLRESIERINLNAQPLEELLNGYTVGDVTFGAANETDLWSM